VRQCDSVSYGKLVVLTGFKTAYPIVDVAIVKEDRYSWCRACDNNKAQAASRALGDYYGDRRPRGGPITYGNHANSDGQGGATRIGPPSNHQRVESWRDDL
jgi:hypothetical protein